MSNDKIEIVNFTSEFIDRCESLFSLHFLVSLRALHCCDLVFVANEGFNFWILCEFFLGFYFSISFMIGPLNFGTSFNWIETQNAHSHSRSLTVNWFGGYLSIFFVAVIFGMFCHLYHTLTLYLNRTSLQHFSLMVSLCSDPSFEFIYNGITNEILLWSWQLCAPKYRNPSNTQPEPVIQTSTTFCSRLHLCTLLNFKQFARPKRWWTFRLLLKMFLMYATCLCHRRFQLICIETFGCFRCTEQQKRRKSRIEWKSSQLNGNGEPKRWVGINRTGITRAPLKLHRLFTFVYSSQYATEHKKFDESD